MTTEINRVLVGGLETVSLSRRALAEAMVHDCMTARRAGNDWLPKLVFSSNGQGVALAAEDAAFLKAMATADIIHADGMPVVFASKLTRHPLPERIATTDFFHDAAEAATEHKLKFFMLGATEAQNEAAVRSISRMYPSLKIVGRRNGYFTEAEDEDVCAEVRASGADVLWVALGKPKQEFWSVRNRHRLAGVGWVKTCGGLYAFLAGDAPRAPQWMQSLGLEWLYRGLQEPRRLGTRYLVTNPYAFYQLVRRTEWSRWQR